MDPGFIVAIVGIIIMIVLILLNVPIAVAMGVVGVMGFMYLMGPSAALGIIKTIPFTSVKDYSLSVIPLFVLMGNFALTAGLSRELYTLGNKMVGHMPGGLAMATVIACAGFGAICGSGPATAATMGTVSIPEMRRYKYAPSLACGCVAAGGCLGMLIPPSVGFIVYGILIGESIGKLFMAGIMAGILLMLLYCVVILIIATRRPDMAPRGEKASGRDILIALKNVWAVVVLFVLVIGGLLIGLFTATEGAAIGAFGALIIAIVRRTMTWQNFITALKDTLKTTTMIFAIMIGAYMLGYFLTITKLPSTLAAMISGTDINKYVILLIIFAIYLFLGCIMDSLAMILITVPIFFPGIVALGFDPIWFGVFIVYVMNQGMITPPVGMNVFVIKAITKDIPIHVIFKGVLPFWIAIFVAVLIIMAFPDLVLFLPHLAA